MKLREVARLGARESILHPRRLVLLRAPGRAVVVSDGRIQIRRSERQPGEAHGRVGNQKLPSAAGRHAAAGDEL
jgi:hypothetical protein